MYPVTRFVGALTIFNTAPGGWRTDKMLPHFVQRI
jgi:hypothetical protein